MKIILYPTTRLGKLLLSWGWVKPTIVNCQFKKEIIEVTCNKESQLMEMEIEFEESFTTHFQPKNDEQKSKKPTTGGEN